MERNKRYTDIELLSFLESQGKSATYADLIYLRENPEVFEKMVKDAEKVEEEIPAIPEEIINPSKTEDKKVETPVVINKKPKCPLIKKINNNGARVLEAFLTEDCGMTHEEFTSLNEETQIESIKEITLGLINSIQEKLKTIDTTCADRSRGDIKNLRELPVLQDVITKLEALVERDENAIPEYSKAIAIVIKSILYVNQYSMVFKDAYRNKKTLMILKYQSLILSIITSVSYLISTIVDYKVDHLTLKRNVENIENFAPLKSLEQFIQSVDSGEFKLVTGDVSTLREYYLEVPVETMSTVLEATDYMSMISDGIQEIYQSVMGNGKITNLLYKAAGVVILVLSLRDVLYTVFRMKSRISDMIGGLENFANLNNGANVLNKLSQFTNRFRTDAENGSDMSKREIEDENKSFLRDVKTIQREVKSNPTPTTMDVNNAPVDTFEIDF